MKDTIFLTVDRRGVQGMRKSYTGAKRGEVIVKLNVTVPQEAFSPPVLDQEVVVNDWRDGIDLEDVEFNQAVITQEEADIIKEKRLAKMVEILDGHGYDVQKREEEQE